MRVEGKEVSDKILVWVETRNSTDLLSGQRYKPTIASCPGLTGSPIMATGNILKIEVYTTMKLKTKRVLVYAIVCTLFDALGSILRTSSSIDASAKMP